MKKLAHTPLLLAMLLSIACHAPSASGADSWATNKAPSPSSIGKWCKPDGSVVYTNTGAKGLRYCGEVSQALLCGPDGTKYIGSGAAPAGYVECGNWPRIYAVGSHGYQHNGTFFPTKDIAAQEPEAPAYERPLNQHSDSNASSLDSYLRTLDDFMRRQTHTKNGRSSGDLPMLQDLQPQLEHILRLLGEK